MCIPYFLASTEDNIHIEENTTKCNTITEHRERVLKSAVNVKLISLLDIEVVHYKCVPPDAADYSPSLSYIT
jgi:hypothetical protein